MHGFTIKDLEHLSDVKAHTIRIWEKRYDLFSPSRSNTNIRCYSTDDLQLILDISLLNRHGFKISQLSRLQQNQLQQLINQLNNSSAQQENLVNELFVKMLHLDIIGFEDRLSDYINLSGVNAAISNIIYPFLQKAELLRNEKHLDIEYEHFVSNIIRQKLIVGIEQHTLANHQTKTVVIFSPEDDHYETELLYAQYLLRKQNIKVIYLGTNVPEKDVLQIAVNKNPDYVCVQLNNVVSNTNIEKALDKISRKFEKFRVVITGRQLHSYNRNIPSNIWLSYSVPDAVNYIAK